MEKMIKFENVSKKYGDKYAISNISFEVESGEFYGFLGPNGAGKTTTIKHILGLIYPDEGRVLINGIDVSKDPLGVKSLIGYVPDSAFLYEKLTGREFLRFVGGLYSMNPEEMEKRIEWICDIFDMQTWIDSKAEGFSHGMRQKVVMSAAFLHKPKLLVVDEPTVGLDPPSARLLKEMLKLIQNHGTTIFISSHDLSLVEELTKRMAILHKGKIVAEGTIDDLQKKAEIVGGTLEDLFLKLTDSISKIAYLE